MYLEGRKSFFKPLLQRFYRRVAMNEIYNFEVFYHENIENKLRELLRISKS
jgi:truncated hemoglobin YjbI